MIGCSFQTIDVPKGDYSAVDVDRVDLHTYPGLEHVPWVKADVGPGDCLYIPVNWFHQVSSDEDTFGINFWWTAFDPDADAEYPATPLTLDKVVWSKTEQLRYQIIRYIQEHGAPVTESNLQVTRRPTILCMVRGPAESVLKLVASRLCAMYWCSFSMAGLLHQVITRGWCCGWPLTRSCMVCACVCVCALKACLLSEDTLDPILAKHGGFAFLDADGDGFLSIAEISATPRHAISSAFPDYEVTPPPPHTHTTITTPPTTHHHHHRTRTHALPNHATGV